MGWTPVTTFWVEALGLVGCTLLAVFMWLSAKANYKMQEREAMFMSNVSIDRIVIDATGKAKNSKKSIVFPTEGQVTVTGKKISSASLRSNSDEMEKIGTMTDLKLIGQHLKALFMNPIFVIIIVIGFCYDGTVVCFRYCCCVSWCIM